MTEQHDHDFDAREAAHEEQREQRFEWCDELAEAIRSSDDYETFEGYAVILAECSGCMSASEFIDACVKDGDLAALHKLADYLCVKHNIPRE